METIVHLLDQYGYVILFLSLMLELIALPIPTEPLMSYVGYLIYQHQLNLFISIFAAALGSYCGMTIAYWIGYKLGHPFFNKHGRKFHLGPEKMQKVEAIFQKHGAKFLLVSCFIPGVRHLSGYFTGLSRLSYRSFSLFAGLGVFIWTTVFISLGDILGPQWMLIEKSLKKYMVLGAVFIVVITFYKEELIAVIRRLRMLLRPAYSIHCRPRTCPPICCGWYRKTGRHINVPLWPCWIPSLVNVPYLMFLAFLRAKRKPQMGMPPAVFIFYRPRRVSRSVTRLFCRERLSPVLRCCRKRQCRERRCPPELYGPA